MYSAKDAQRKIEKKRDDDKNTEVTLVGRFRAFFLRFGSFSLLYSLYLYNFIHKTRAAIEEKRK